MRYPPEVLERVRAATDIVALIGEQVKLIKAGRSYKGLCPFHQEKTPSFTVNPALGVYHCFGCGKGGNAITFLMEHAKLSFGEAVRHLADRTGVELPNVSADAGKDGELAALMTVLAFAAEFYRERFLHPVAGEAARAYLERRGLPEELAERFGMGFAPAGWTNLRDAARRKYAPDVLTRAGLLVAKEDGSHYDRFRNRLMIPVESSFGRVIGFGGRAIGDEEPKYINSPESPVYQKGQILFGLPQARDAMNRLDEAILVEGYLDQLRVFGAGFENVVAVAGTAFTPHQAALLKRYVKRVILLFDGDRAGAAAAWKNAAPCLAAGLEVRVAALPEAHDPDSLIRDEGVGRFKELLDRAAGIVEYAGFGLLPRLGREETLRELVTLIKQVPDPIRRRLMIQESAEKFRFDEATLVRAVESNRSTELAVSTPAGHSAPLEEADPAERDLVALLIAHPDIRAQLEPLDGIEFHDPVCRELYRLMQADPEGRPPIDQILENEADSQLARAVSRLLANPALQNGAVDPVRWANDCRKKLIHRALKETEERLDEELRSAELSRDPERSRAILREKMELRRKRQRLETGAKS